MEEKDKRLESQTEHNENGKDNEQDYEKICYICRRPESKAGSMIVMPRSEERRVGKECRL